MADAGAAVSGGGRAGWTLAVVLGVWAVFLFPSLAALALYGAAAGALDQDDAMRLVQVRDLLAGQGWFDNMQYRLGPGGGTAMHWSRVVDAPIAGLMLVSAALLGPWLGPAAAEGAVIVAWPLLLALVPLAAAVVALHRLEGRVTAVLGGVLMAQMLVHTRAFAPTALDHHNVQVALLVLAAGLAMVGLARPDRGPGPAAGAGLAVATSLAVGIETLPHLAALGAFMALHWALRGAAARPATVAFAAALGLGAAALFAATAPAEAWRGGFCDAFSADQAVPLLTAAAGLALAALALSDRPALLRLAALAAVAVLVGAVTLIWAPACLASPLDALDPRLRALWFDRVAEARPLFESVATTAPYLVPLIVVWLLGMAATIALVLAGRGREAWVLVGLMLLVSLPMTLWQNRAAIFIGPLAALPLGALIGRLYGRGVAGARAGLRLAALALFALSTPQVWALAATRLAPSGTAAPGAPAGGDTGGPTAAATATEGSAALGTQPEDCLTAEAFATLAALPPGLVSGSSNLGAFVLLHTPHRALSAPYHRNQAGMLAELRIGYGTDAAAAEELRAQGVDYVIACDGDPEYAAEGRGDLGFGFRLVAGGVPGFLEPVAAAEGAAVRVYLVRAGG